MPAPRKIQGSRYLLLGLLLLSAGSMAGAREVRLHGPNGDGGCPDADAPASATIATPAKSSTPAATRNVKIKPVITVRGGGDDGSSSHAPRWHSFLPGMFR